MMGKQLDQKFIPLKHLIWAEEPVRLYSGERRHFASSCAYSPLLFIYSFPKLNLGTLKTYVIGCHLFSIYQAFLATVLYLQDIRYNMLSAFSNSPLLLFLPLLSKIPEGTFTMLPPGGTGTSTWLWDSGLRRCFSADLLAPPTFSEGKKIIFLKTTEFQMKPMSYNALPMAKEKIKIAVYSKISLNF